VRRKVEGRWEKRTERKGSFRMEEKAKKKKEHLYLLVRGGRLPGILHNFGCK
jgi:hypothetical protein